MQCYSCQISLFFCFLLFFSGSVSAKKWDFQPNLSVSESYFDNITLAPDDSGNKNSEFITRLLPGFSLSRTGRRLKLNALYALGYIKYSGKAFSDRTYNQGSLSADAELIRRHLFVNASASVSQQVYDPSRAFVSAGSLGGGYTGLDNSAVYVTDNQVETRSVNLQPRLVNKFGPFANSRLSYDYSILNYSNARITNYQRSTLNYNLSSGRWFKTLSWYANAIQSTSTQSNSNYLSTLLRADLNLSRHWGLFAMTRAQQYSYLDGINESQYFINPEAGIVWNASRKLKAEIGGGGSLDAGDLSRKQITIVQKTWRASATLSPTVRTILSLGRSATIYGDQRYMNFSHRMRRSNWSSTYSEFLITPQQLRNSSVLNSVGGGLGGGAFAGNFGGGLNGVGGSGGSVALGRAVTDDVLLRKRLNVNINISRKKTTLTAGSFYDKGEYQTSNVTDKRYGVNGGVNVQLGRLMNWSNQLSVQRYYFDNGNRADNIATFNSVLSKTIKKDVSGSLSYQLRKRDSSTGVSNYTAQMVIAQLDITF